MALITVLLITALLVTMVTDFIFRVYLASSRAGELRQAAAASVLASDGVELARAGLDELLRRDANLVTDEAGLSFSRPVGEGLSVQIRAVDELGKVSARIAYPMTGAAEPRAYGIFIRLLKARGAEESLASALADWIDSDSAARSGGAEQGYYRSLSTPYAPRDGYLSSVDELLLVKGFTPGVVASIGPYVTPYSHDGLVNINTAPRPVLMALTEEMTGELADELIRYRKSRPFRDRSDVMRVPGFTTVGIGLQDRVSTSSRLFRVWSRAAAGGVIREVEAVVQVGGGVLYWREM